jgi:hypothetical protein
VSEIVAADPQGRIRSLQRTVRVSRRNRYQPEHLDRMAVNGPGLAAPFSTSLDRDLLLVWPVPAEIAGRPGQDPASTCPALQSEEVRFVPDSPVEGTGFETLGSAPPLRDRWFADSPLEGNRIRTRGPVSGGEPARTNELSSHHNCGGRSELSPNLMRDERLQFLPQHRRDPG